MALIIREGTAEIRTISIRFWSVTQCERNETESIEGISSKLTAAKGLRCTRLLVLIRSDEKASWCHKRYFSSNKSNKRFHKIKGWEEVLMNRISDPLKALE